MIAIIAGTNRPDAVSLQIAQLYRQLLADRGAESQILNLNHLPPDFAFSALYQNAGKNPEVNKLNQQMAEAEKFVFVIPEYNGSFPGVLKMFIDGLPYPNPMRHKVAALVGLGSGVQGGVLALSHFNDILSYLNVETLALRVKLASINKNLVEGRLQNPLYNELLNAQADRLVAYAPVLMQA
jgi:chromate reductase, NAD(P)H dehydrogenase (quinone)